MLQNAKKELSFQCSQGCAVRTGRELIQIQRKVSSGDQISFMNHRHRAVQGTELSNAGPDGRLFQLSV
jgi:hypothetical protein